jgi:hypothetical protein
MFFTLSRGRLWPADSRNDMIFAALPVTRADRRFGEPVTRRTRVVHGDSQRRRIGCAIDEERLSRISGRGRAGDDRGVGDRLTKGDDQP